LIFNLDFILIILFVFFAGLIAAIFPAYRGSKISIANQLSRTI
jgi:ABC-type lipoprotein release transport system permease subunit